MKPLPNDNITEQTILWCLLIDSELVDKFFEEGQIEWFHTTNNKYVIKAIYELALEWITIDLITVRDKLIENKKLDKVGWALFLAELTELVPASSNWLAYSNTLKDLYQRRTIVIASQKLLNNAYDWDIEKEVDDALSSITYALNEGKSKATSVEDNILLMEKAIAENRGKDLIGRSWWNSFLDQYTKWIRKGKTYRIASPSGVGKTNLLYPTIKSLIEQGAKVMFVSLENSIESTYMKFLSSVQGINPNDIEQGKASADTDFLRRNSHLFILTDQLFDLWDIKREIVKNKPDVVFLDYIGLVSIKGADEKSLYNRYADDVKRFMQIHKELAWVDLSNLNKDDDEEKMRLYKWFNGSAKLRNNTDFALHMFYYKPFYDYKQDIKDNGELWAYKKFENTQVLTFLITKNRLWPDGVEEQFWINFNKGINYKQISEEKKQLWWEL